MKPLRYNYDIGPTVDLALERSGVDFELFRGKRVFVTGGTGFFGVWLLSALARVQDRLDGSLKVVALSRDPAQFLRQYSQFGFEQRIQFVSGDVKHFCADLRDVTHLVHMATTNASETFEGESQLNKLELLYLGTRNVLEQCSPALESALFTSSGVAYGTTRNERITEGEAGTVDTLAAGSALGIGKLAAEYLIAHYANLLGFRFSIARCFAFAGEYLPMDLHYAFGNFIKNALDRTPIVVRGDGRDERSYMYVGDAIAWLLRMLAHPRNAIHNVGSEIPITMRELAQKIGASVVPPIDVAIRGTSDETGNFRRSFYIPSTLRAQNDYPGLAEWTSVDEIITKMLSAATYPAAEFPNPSSESL
jgi:UDP-glucuronate decarboxylase